MPDDDAPPLQSLHLTSQLSASKLNLVDKLTTDVLVKSLLPGEMGCLKTRPDGTILDGHHRIFILRKRGVDVDKLPREIVAKETNDVDETL